MSINWHRAVMNCVVCWGISDKELTPTELEFFVALIHAGEVFRDHPERRENILKLRRQTEELYKTIEQLSEKRDNKRSEQELQSGKVSNQEQNKPGKSAQITVLEFAKQTDQFLKEFVDNVRILEGCLKAGTET